MRTTRAISPKGRRNKAALVMLLALLAWQAPLLAAMPRAERHESRHEIDQMEEAWRTAVLQHKVKAMAALLAEDYLAITPRGMLISKQQTLTNLRSGATRFTSIAYSDRKVRFYGNTAVVTSRAHVNGASPEGPLVGVFRYTRVYVREADGQWKIVSFEASRVRRHGRRR